jgi:uncharacterized membrane protein YgdD (TMEM256/DUF423 family)
MNNKKSWLIISGVAGFSGVALGAFGAHGLKDLLLPEMLENYRTGVFYHLIHAAVIAAIGISSSSRFYKAAFFFLAGIILFSFSLYVYAGSQLLLFAFITPIGGISFLIGWALLVYEGVKTIKNS